MPIRKTLTIALFTGFGSLHAAVAPYTPDAHTIVLFHFNESSGTTTANAGPAGRNAYACDGNPITTTPSAVSTILGAAGHSAFGNAADLSGNPDWFLGFDANAPLGYRADTSGTSLSSDAIALSTLGIGNANPFTLEALAKPSATTGNRQILCTDSSAANRGFQFRIIQGGSTGQQLEFNLVGIANTQRFAEIPTTGTHAFTPGTWFHVAFTYDGSQCRFYWTKVDPSVTQANLLGSTQGLTLSGSGTITGPLILGNENRNTAGEGLNGAIDEVRISNLARDANAFIFSSNDADADGLDDSWEMTYFGNIAAYNGSSDPDTDGFDNESEETAGSLPNQASSTPLDLDADGLTDSWEIIHFGNTQSQNASNDPDGDFASNLIEQATSTNPNDPTSWPDTDQDGMNDGWEIHWFGQLSATPSADADGDGFTNLQEHQANSSPTNSQWSPSQSLLAHRWSFNNSLNDSVGTSHAQLVDPDSNNSTGPATLGSDVVQLTGGTRASASYLNLGNGLLNGHKTPVTLELWATPTAIQNWSRIFDAGSGTSEYLFMSWTQGTTLASDRVEWLDSSSTTANNTCAPYTLNTAYHLVLSLEPRAGVNGTTRVTWYAAPASAFSLGSARGTFDSTNTLLNFNDSAFFLGRSQWTADNTASAKYDEFRIWDGALTTIERENLHAFGPDITTTADSDQDGLPDGWELSRFGNLDQTGSGDPDSDQYSNLQEYLALSNPNNSASVPGDIDGDTLPDTWEITYFGHLLQSPANDPDGDGESNRTEYVNSSAPNNRASNSTDRDADGLTDSWETTYFGNLESNAGDDPDGDRFSNLQEFIAGTLPHLSSSRPNGTAVKLVPVDDDLPTTSEFGYAGNSAINTVAFARSSLHTVGNQQFLTYYGRHQFDATSSTNNTIWIARRTLGSSHWQVFRHPTFTANTITDGHDVIAFGIDGDGYMHLSWGMHGDAFHYSRSTTPVTGSGPITLGPDTTMTGREATVTYPQFLTLPDGDLLYLFREGASGSGDVYLNRYDVTTRIWDNVHRSGNTQLPFIKGTGWTPDYNAYPNMPQLGGDGDDLILTWCWRYNGDSPAGESGYQTNNQLAFARSPDAGITWNRSTGTPYSLPISRNGESGVPSTAAEHIVQIPEGSSLINQASMTLDSNDNPVTATWWAPLASSGNHRRQYQVVFRHDNGTWQTRTVSNRTIDPTTTKFNESYVRNLGRPVVVTDPQDRIIVAYRDNQNTNGITLVHSLPKAQDPDRLLWIEFDLTQENLGNFEPIIDHDLWEQRQQLHFIYQASEGEGYTTTSNLAARMSVLEWDGDFYFNHSSQPSLSFSPDRSQVHLTCPSEPSWSYRLWSSTDLTHWQIVETRAGTGQPLTFSYPANQAEKRRFWRIQTAEGGF